MVDKRRRQPGRGASSRPIAISLKLAGAALVVAVLALSLGRSSNWSVALGDTLLVEAGLFFVLAWFTYLKKDGLRILPKKRGAAIPSSWGDRVPNLDETPSPTMPMPGPEGPQGEEYRRLAAAEEALRRRIIGEGDGSVEMIDKERNARGNSGVTIDFLAAGGFSLALALLFEYLVPALIK